MDKRVRELERLTAQGDLLAKRRLLGEYIRYGHITRNDVLLAAAYDDEAAVRFLGFKPTTDDLLFSRDTIQNEHQSRTYQLSAERYIGPYDPNDTLVRIVTPDVNALGQGFVQICSVYAPYFLERSATIVPFDSLIEAYNIGAEANLYPNSIYLEILWAMVYYAIDLRFKNKRDVIHALRLIRRRLDGDLTEDLGWDISDEREKLGGYQYMLGSEGERSALDALLSYLRLITGDLTQHRPYVYAHIYNDVMDAIDHNWTTEAQKELFTEIAKHMVPLLLKI